MCETHCKELYVHYVYKTLLLLLFSVNDFEIKYNQTENMLISCFDPCNMQLWHIALRDPHIMNSGLSLYGYYNMLTKLQSVNEK